LEVCPKGWFDCHNASQARRTELGEFAAAEKRTLANFGAVLLEWGSSNGRWLALQNASSNTRFHLECVAANKKARQVLEMGEWKTALSIRVRQSLKDDLQKIADREYRKLGNLGELLMEWSYEQLTAAGSTAKLLKRRVRASPPGSKQP
jgi:hypothetical protein